MFFAWNSFAVSLDLLGEVCPFTKCQQHWCSQFQFIDWLCAIMLFWTSSNHIDRFSPWHLASTKHHLIWRWNAYSMLYFSPPKIFTIKSIFFLGRWAQIIHWVSQSVLFLVCDVQTNPIKMISLDYENSLFALLANVQFAIHKEICILFACTVASYYMIFFLCCTRVFFSYRNLGLCIYFCWNSSWSFLFHMPVHEDYPEYFDTIF